MRSSRWRGAAERWGDCTGKGGGEERESHGPPSPGSEPEIRSPRTKGPGRMGGGIGACQEPGLNRLGHHRLGTIPKSQKWAAVVAEVAGGQGPASAQGLQQKIPELARRTLEAAQAGLERASDDPGLCFTSTCAPIWC